MLPVRSGPRRWKGWNKRASSSAGTGGPVLATEMTAIALVNRLSPDVVVMDLLMPDMDGFAATRHIHAACPQTRVVILTSYSAEGQVLRALRAGACSYLLKDAEAGEIAAAIRKAMNNQAATAPAIGSTVAERLARRPSEQVAGLAQLTDRELRPGRLTAGYRAGKPSAPTATSSTCWISRVGCGFRSRSSTVVASAYHEGMTA